MEEKIIKYFNILKEENAKINLTSITSFEEARIKHFEDSLKLFSFFTFEKNAKIADLGSGAGFPGIMMKLRQPDLNVDLVEATAKKCTF